MQTIPLRMAACGDSPGARPPVGDLAQPPVPEAPADRCSPLGRRSRRAVLGHHLLRPLPLHALQIPARVPRWDERAPPRASAWDRPPPGALLHRPSAARALGPEDTGRAQLKRSAQRTQAEPSSSARPKGHRPNAAKALARMSQPRPSWGARTGHTAERSARAWPSETAGSGLRAPPRGPTGRLPGRRVPPRCHRAAPRPGPGGSCPRRRCLRRGASGSWPRAGC
jgi:hypothetical protein